MKGRTCPLKAAAAMINPKSAQAPTQLGGIDKAVSCNGEDCAWWDDYEKCCAIVAMPIANRKAP